MWVPLAHTFTHSLSTKPGQGHRAEGPLALTRAATYAGSVVKQPFSNEKEKPTSPDPFSTATDNKADSIARRMASGGIRIPRGVFRFKTHEEADEWWERMIARNQPKKD